MKKFSIVAAALLAIAGQKAFAQGTVVFNNSNASLVTYAPGSPDSGSLAVGNTVLLALYWGPAGSAAGALTQIGGTTTIGPVVGRYSGGTRTTGAGTAAGATAVFQVKAWSASMGATYEEALTRNGGYIGASPLFTSSTGGVGQPASAAVPLSATAVGFAVTFVPVPEPGTIALGLLGATALLLRRKKA